MTGNFGTGTGVVENFAALLSPRLPAEPGVSTVTEGCGDAAVGCPSWAPVVTLAWAVAWAGGGFDADGEAPGEEFIAAKKLAGSGTGDSFGGSL